MLQDIIVREIRNTNVNILYENKKSRVNLYLGSGGGHFEHLL